MVFGSFERQLLTEIASLNYDNANALQLIKRSTLTDKALIINFQQRTIKFLVLLNDRNWIGSFFETVFFLDECEKNGLIYLHSNNPDLPEDLIATDVYITNNINQNYIDENSDQLGLQEVPTNFFEKIERFNRSFIIPTNKLRELVNHKFKSEEQLNFEKNLKFTRFSLAIALLALFFSFISPFIFDTSINAKQFDQIIHSIKANHAK